MSLSHEAANGHGVLKLASFKATNLAKNVTEAVHKKILKSDEKKGKQSYGLVEFQILKIGRLVERWFYIVSSEVTNPL